MNYDNLIKKCIEKNYDFQVTQLIKVSTYFKPYYKFIGNVAGEVYRSFLHLVNHFFLLLRFLL